MGTTAEIEMCFPKEKHARWAMHVAEEMLKVAYASPDLPWVEEAASCPSLSARYLAFRHEAAEYPLDRRYTALEWLRRFRNKLFIDRCQDIAGWTGIDDPEDLFPQLCFAYALRFPQVPFAARYRYEMTVSGAIQLIRVQYDGTVMHIRVKTGMLPMDEDDWSNELIHDYRVEGGAFVRKGTTDPMKEVKESRATAIALALDTIQKQCRPLLITLSGSIAYGLETPDSDIDIRGIFLNEPEEWIGLRKERESIRLEESDTILYGLRKAMKLLLECNPNIVEILGLQKKDILYCSDDGRRILEAGPIFLSKKAIFTFGAYATTLRRQIQKQIDEGITDKKELGKAMMHLIRIYDMGADLLTYGRVITYRQDTHNLLMCIRKGVLQDQDGKPTSEYDRTLEYFMGAFHAAAAETHLPAEPDMEKANALTMEIAGRILQGR